MGKALISILITIIVFIILTFTTPYTHAIVLTQINATGTREASRLLVTHVLARYGPQTNYNVTTQPILPPAEDVNLCNPLNTTYDFSNQIVLAQRGNCSFVTKSRVAQLFGAVGVIIGNFDDDLIVPSYDERADDYKNITIPTVLIRKTAFSYIVNATEHSTPDPSPLPPYPPNSTIHTTDESPQVSYAYFDSIHRISRDEFDAFIDHIDNSTDRHSPLSDSNDQRPHSLPYFIKYLPYDDDNNLNMTLFGPDYAKIQPLSLDAATSPSLLWRRSLRRAVYGLTSRGQYTPSLAPTPTTTFSAPFNNDTSRKDALSQEFIEYLHDLNIFVLGDQNTPQLTSHAMHTMQVPPNPTNFYFYVTVDERGQADFVKLPLREIQLILSVLFVIPAAWIIWLTVRWVRLFWGMKCVSYMISNTAEKALPQFTFIRTSPNGHILYGDAEDEEEEHEHGAILSTEQQQPVGSNGNRRVYQCPDEELFTRIKNTPTASANYVAVGLAGVTGAQKTFRAQIKNNTDVKDMMYQDFISQELVPPSSPVPSPTAHVRVHNDTCHICMCSLNTGDIVKILFCFHTYHAACLDQHFGATGSRNSSNPGDSTNNNNNNIVQYLVYLGNYEFEELRDDYIPDNGSDPETTLRNNVVIDRLISSQQCPSCRKSLLISARENRRTVQKPWWIGLFQVLCLCSCCGRRRHRDEATIQTPILQEDDTPLQYSGFRYDSEVSFSTQRTSLQQPAISP